jgi:hypothetical protein
LIFKLLILSYSFTGVITTIHQPRTKIWNLLDDILLLTPQGKYAYFGPKDEILAYFSGIGYPCPEHTNPAEFFIDLVSYDTSNPEAYIQSKNRIEEITRHFQLYWKLKASNMTDVTSDTQITANYSDNASVYTTKTYNKVNGYEKKYYMRKLSPTRFIKSRALKFGKFFQSFFGKLAKIVKRPTILINELEYSLRRFSLLLLRASRQTGRDMLTNIVRLLVSGAIAGIVGSVYGYQGADTLGTSYSIQDCSSIDLCWKLSIVIVIYNDTMVHQLNANILTQELIMFRAA